MTFKVLVTAPYMLPMPDEYRRQLEAAGVQLVIADVRERLSEDELLPLVKDIDGVICGDDHFTERVLCHATQLKVISKWGTGIDSIDVEAAKRAGIRVCKTPDAFSQPVADTTLGCILGFARHVAGSDSDVRRGVWAKRKGVALNETTLGIIGVGNVGGAVARRAKAFGMGLLGTDPVTPPADLIKETGIAMVGFSDLIERSDFVSIHCDLNSTSLRLIDNDAFKAMKRSAYLINTARGPIVDEAALVEALSTGQIAGAALDVFEVEPLPDHSPLRKLDNCLLSPHNSNASPTAHERVHRSTVDNLLAALTDAE
jgi:D-3-phosphoglycerate dehydrogenase / 2-oxoglutarate reductase